MKRISLLGTLLFLSFLVFAQNPLLIPSVLTGANIELTLQTGMHEFFDGQMTNTLGANGDILGPTLILNQGDLVSFSVQNLLEDSTTMHWHGLHVAPENDGGPHTVIAQNSTWSPSFTILDKAATYWYHPHLHHMTNKHVSLGIAGMIIVKDSEEAALDLPRDYGVDDFPLVIQTKDFDEGNQIVVQSNNDDVVMVNATIDPYLEAPAQFVRLRILNGSSQRTFNLGMTDDQPFYQIASDGGLLSAPFETTRLLVAPGERAELLVDFTDMEGQSPQLLSFASEIPDGIYGATNPGMMAMLTLDGYNPNELNGNDFVILDFNIMEPTSDPVTSVPTALANLSPLLESDADITRTLSFAPEVMGPNQLNGMFQINNASFDMEVVNYSIPLNNTEIWQLTNNSGIAHPFHIHDVQFYILSRNGVSPAENEQGLKDVVLVKPQETVRFIAKFEDFSNDEVPYMYHCHMLVHEDGGMMGQFVVSNETSIDESLRAFDNPVIYPNPNQGTFHFQNSEQIDSIEVYNALGQEVGFTMNNRGGIVTISGLVRGLNMVKFQSGDLMYMNRVLVD